MTSHNELFSTEKPRYSKDDEGILLQCGTEDPIGRVLREYEENEGINADKME